jgi:pimeloyl-ACP methyl ester carboxylesterase
VFGYKKALPGAEMRLFENKGHFLQRSFPEFIKTVKSIL